jgi:hypothetical protein
MKLLLFALSITIFNSYATSGSLSPLEMELSESDCKTIGDSAYFEMRTGVVGCNSAYAGADLENSSLSSGKCQLKFSLVRSQTEAGCGSGPQISFEPVYPIAVRKFNRICKKLGFKRVSKSRDKYGDRHITCLQK